MKRDVIKLKSGYELAVKAMQIQQTNFYEVLVGESNVEDSYNVQNGLRIPLNWSVEKLIYKKADFKLDTKLHTYTVMIWLECDTSLFDSSNEYDYSELAVAFTIPTLIDFSLEKYVKEGFDDFPWENYAVNRKI